MVVDWKVTAQSRLDSSSIDLSVSIPTNLGITLQIEESEFSIGDIVMIKGIALSNSNRLYIEITDESDQIITKLERKGSKTNPKILHVRKRKLKQKEAKVKCHFQL